MLSVLRYDGDTGTFIDEFVSTTGFALDLTFDFRGDLLVSNSETLGIETVGAVRRYDGITGELDEVLISPGSGGLGAPRGGLTFARLRVPVGVPEPSTLMLMSIGLVGLGWMGRRRRKSP